MLKDSIKLTYKENTIVIWQGNGQWLPSMLVYLIYTTYNFILKI